MSMRINNVSMILELDRFPPSVNHAYYHIKKGKAFIKVKTKETKDFIKYVHSQFPETYTEIQNDGMTYKQFNVEPFKCPVQVEIVITFGDKRKHDIDNILKIILDSLIGKAYVDDNQIEYLVIRKVMGNAHHLKVSIRKTKKDILKRCPECGRSFNIDYMVFNMTDHIHYCKACWDGVLNQA